jgi:hypothetical protein
MLGVNVNGAGAGLAVCSTLLRLEVERLALDDFQIFKNFEKSSMKSFQIALSLLMLSTEGTLAAHSSHRDASL